MHINTPTSKSSPPSSFYQLTHIQRKILTFWGFLTMEVLPCFRGELGVDCRF
jgi:hypothetical protein